MTPQNPFSTEIGSQNKLLDRTANKKQAKEVIVLHCISNKDESSDIIEESQFWIRNE